MKLRRLKLYIDYLEWEVRQCANPTRKSIKEKDLKRYQKEYDFWLDKHFLALNIN